MIATTIFISRCEDSQKNNTMQKNDSFLVGNDFFLFFRVVNATIYKVMHLINSYQCVIWTK